jgi:hypothetical protein
MISLLKTQRLLKYRPNKENRGEPWSVRPYSLYLIVKKMDWRIKIHRKINDREWRDNPNTFCVFMHCIFLANFEDKKWHWENIPRWSFVTSYWNLSNHTWISIRGIRTSIEHLKTTWELTTKTTNKYTLITVVWYDKYQYNEKQTTSKTTNNWQTTDNQTTTTKEYKNIRTKEDKEKNNTKVLATPEFGNTDINFLLEKIKIYNNGIVDWTQKEQRQYWKLLLDKLNKIESVQSWKYTAIEILEIILKIVWENSYHSQKIVWPKKIFYELAWLMQICKQDFEKQNKSKMAHIPWV